MIHMLLTKFFVSFARRGRDEAKTVLGAVGIAHHRSYFSSN